MHRSFALLFLGTAILVSCASNTDDSSALPNPPGDSGVGGGSDAATGGSSGGDCSPKTCAQLNANCGIAPDTCGGSVDCGSCAVGSTCGAQAPNECGSGTCTPRTCVQLGSACGVVSDGCAAVIDCGSCPPNQVCLVSSGAGSCVDGTGGTGGTGGSGGTGGAGGSGGTGGTGGTTCAPADFCQANNHDSGWFCDGTLRVLCGSDGSCSEVVDQQECGVVGCTDGACNDPCGTLCSGRCGTYQGCSCGGCSGSDVCSNNVCVECVNGSTDSRSCDPGMYCPLGTQTRLCSGDTWDAWGTCAASGYRFYGDGGKHCADDLANKGVLCVEVAPTGSDYDPKVTVSKTGGGTFDNDVEVRVLQPGTSNVQHFGCQPIAGFNAVIVHLNPSMFTISSGSTIPIRAEVTSPCAGTYEAWSEDGYLSQCKP